MFENWKVKHKPTCKQYATKVPKYFIVAWVIGDIYVAQKFSLTFEKWLCLCYRSFCCCCGKIVKASFVFDLARTKKWKKQRHRGVGGGPRDRSVVKLLQNKNFAFFHIVLQYFSDFSVLRKTHTFDFPPQMSFLVKITYEICRAEVSS